MDSTPSGTPIRIPLMGPPVRPGDAASILGGLDGVALAAGGPVVREFEEAFAAYVGARHALAVSSGTAALHLALRLVGAVRGDEVFVSSLGPPAAIDPVLYVGAVPVFVDVDPSSWTMDPLYLSRLVEDRGRRGKPPAAVVVLHLAGCPAELTPLATSCERWEVPLIEDACEAVGALYHGRPVGTQGRLGVFAFEGDGPLGTIAGGMLVSNDDELVEWGRKLAAHTREPSSAANHREMRYDYRMSGPLAALGRASLDGLDERVEARRAVHARYQEGLAQKPGIAFQPEVAWGRHARRYSLITVDPDAAGVDRDAVRTALAEAGIEARPLWGAAHRLPLYLGLDGIGGRRAEEISARALCLPSGYDMTEAEADEVTEVVAACLEGALRPPAP